jgi:murein L,D-transpeptidase YcbB/YkuD
MEFRVSADIIDQQGNVVSTTAVDWRLAPVKTTE